MRFVSRVPNVAFFSLSIWARGRLRAVNLIYSLVLLTIITHLIEKYRRAIGHRFREGRQCVCKRINSIHLNWIVYKNMPVAFRSIAIELICRGFSAVSGPRTENGIVFHRRHVVAAAYRISPETILCVGLMQPISLPFSYGRLSVRLFICTAATHKNCSWFLWAAERGRRGDFYQINGHAI